MCDLCIPLLLVTLGLLLTASRGRAFASSLGGQLFTWSLTPEFSISLLDTGHGFQTSRVGGPWGGLVAVSMFSAFCSPITSTIITVFFLLLSL